MLLCKKAKICQKSYLEERAISNIMTKKQVKYKKKSREGVGGGKLDPPPHSNTVVKKFKIRDGMFKHLEICTDVNYLVLKPLKQLVDTNIY